MQTARAREIERNEHAQHAVLELIANGEPLRAVLTKLIREIEAMQGDVIGSVLLLDAATRTVRHGAAPSLPAAYVSRIEGAPIGPAAGSCGTAMHCRTRVIVSDIESDPLWADYKLLALGFGLRACWSEPVFASTGEVLGSFAMYYRAPRTPTETDIERIMLGSKLAAIAIERERSLEALRESEEAYRTIYERAPIGIVNVDQEGRFLRANPAFCMMLGYTERELRARRFDMLTHPEDVPRSRELFAALVSGERDAFEVEKRYLRRDGSTLPARLTVSAVRDGDGRLLRTVSMIEDTTERTRAELALRESEEQLRQSQKMEAIGQLAGGIAHDFNNLLTVIGVCSARIQKELPEGHPLAHPAEQIRRAGQSAAALTRQLLTFSRRSVVAPRNLDVGALLRELDPMLRRLLGEDVEVVYELDEHLRVVRADPSQIEQIVVNLAVNARDAMPSGGRLVLRTQNATMLSKDASETLPCIVLAMEDEGTGMDEGTVQRIFEPFFTTKEAGKGTGLGLSTVYGIVEQSEGRITVSSELGHGTRFEVWLPAVDARADSIVPPPSDEMPTGDETVLLVEDDEAVREICYAALRQSGFTVHVAEDGPSALAQLANEGTHVDLLVTDLVMPRMSGRALAEALRAHHPALRTLYISGYTDDAVVRHGVSRETTAFLQKPFDTAGLVRAVRNALDAGKRP